MTFGSGFVQMLKNRNIMGCSIYCSSCIQYSWTKRNKSIYDFDWFNRIHFSKLSYELLLYPTILLLPVSHHQAAALSKDVYHVYCRLQITQIGLNWKWKTHKQYECWELCWYTYHLTGKTTVLPSKRDSGVIFCLQLYQGIIIDISLVY